VIVITLGAGLVEPMSRCTTVLSQELSGYVLCTFELQYDVITAAVRLSGGSNLKIRWRHKRANTVRKANHGMAVDGNAKYRICEIPWTRSGVLSDYITCLLTVSIKHSFANIDNRKSCREWCHVVISTTSRDYTSHTRLNCWVETVEQEYCSFYIA